MKLIILFLLLLISFSCLNASNIYISNIEAINDSTKKAKIMVLNSLNDIITPIQEDIRIIENGEEVEIVSIDCIKDIVNEPISSVLTIDVSGSMIGEGLEIAKEAANTWVEDLFNYNKNSECGITTFSTYSNLLQNLTNNELYLKASINSFYAGGWTNYDDGFYDKYFGGLNVLKNGKYKKVLIFLTDGFPCPNLNPNEQRIIELAKQHDITIYPVVIGSKAPSLLKRIALATGGQCFDDVLSREQANKIYKTILKLSIIQNPCEIVWKSRLKCGNINFNYIPFILTQSINFSLPSSEVPQLITNSKIINFGQTKQGFLHDTTLTFYAKNDTIKIDTFFSINNQYSINISNNEFPIILAPGDTVDVEIKLKVQNKDSLYNFVTIVSNSCAEVDFELMALDLADKPSKPQVRDGFGVTSLLFETKSLSNFKYNGYNIGAGIQFYLSKNIGIRISYGFSEYDYKTLLTDRSSIINNVHYISGLLRYNILRNTNMLGYLGFQYNFSFALSEDIYNDGFSKGYNLFSHHPSIVLGAELFAFHNVSISCEYNIGVKFINQDYKIGYEEKKYFQEYRNTSIQIIPKLNIILSYFIN